MMAKKEATEQADKSPILPLPESVISHHAETLHRLMKQWQETKRVPPVLLLTGPSGVGKRSMSYYLAQWLLCERSGFQNSTEQEGFGGLFGDSALAASTGKLEPCGECANCHKALHQNWVDFQEITSTDEDGDTGALKIDQFRRLKASLGFGAFDGAYRVILIRDADRMTIQAANSILKILEEPPHGWIFLLTASDASLLLTTIVSRCQTVRLRPFTENDLLKLLTLSDVPKERHLVAAHLAQGSWGKALELGSDEVWERRKQILRFIENPLAEANSLLDWAAQENEHMALLFDQLEQLTRELLQDSFTDGKTRAPLDQKKALAAHATLASKKLGSTPAARKFWIARAERISQARQESLAPLNKKLLVQDVLLPWLEI